MQNKKLSIRRIVSYLNDDEAEGGGFWLPNIQRPFVWSEEQIARLFDSVMRQYPIGTLLAWKTKDPIKHRRFIDIYRHDLKLTAFYVPESSRSKLLVLDGQQRLQSLFIGLRGSYEGRELYLNILSGAPAAPEDIRYQFDFLDKSAARWPWVRFKDIIWEKVKLDGEIGDELQAKAAEPLSVEQTRRVQRNVGRARQEFVNDDNVTYQELDSLEEPEAYKLDDVVEIFIRANSGGTKLGKSDLLFSLLAASWEDSEGEMEGLLEDLNQNDFEFDRDFVLKSCLTMLDKGARYEVKKFRDETTKAAIVEQWEALAAAVRDVRDWLVSNTYVRTGKAMPSYLALIPLIYYRYKYPSRFHANRDLREYVLRTLVTGSFSGSPDNLIDKIVKNINEKQDFVLAEVFGVIREDGRNLEITPELVFEQGYRSPAIHLFFNLWYPSFDYTPAMTEHGPQIDHVFPQSALTSVKDVNPETGKRNVLRYRIEQRDQIANCMLLTAKENGFGEKSGITPDKWFAPERFETAAKQQEYVDLHLIPKDPALWKLENFEAFIAARKQLIQDKFKFMLHGVQPDRAVPDVKETAAPAAPVVPERPPADDLKEYRTRYWRGFADYLRSEPSAVCQIGAPVQKGAAPLVQIGETAVLKAYCSPRMNKPGVYLRLKGPLARSTFNRLSESKAEIERAIGVSLEWQEKKAGENYHIVAAKEDGVPGRTMRKK